MNSLSGASYVTFIHSVYQYSLRACRVQGKEVVSTPGIWPCPSQMDFCVSMELTFLSGGPREPGFGLPSLL